MDALTDDRNVYDPFKLLVALAITMRLQGFEASVIKAEGADKQPYCRIVNTDAGRLAEHVTCKQVDDEPHYIWSWGSPIAPVRHVESAAERVAYVLTPSGV